MNPLDWIRDARQYFIEVHVEWTQITWPPQKEAFAGTVSVMVVVAIITTALGIVDYALSQIMRLVLN